MFHFLGGKGILPQTLLVILLYTIIYWYILLVRVMNFTLYLCLPNVFTFSYIVLLHTYMNILISASVNKPMHFPFAYRKYFFIETFTRILQM